MRPLEIILPLVLALYLLWPLTGRRRTPAVGLLPAFAFVVVVTHGRVEGLRWQMYPLYGFTILLFLLSLPAYLRARGEGLHQPRPAGRKLAGLSAALALLAVSTALPALLPVPSIPRPSGDELVGTSTRLLVDETRREIYSGQDEPRRFMLQFWYPAQPPTPELKPAAWMPDAALIAPEIAEYIGLPRFFLDHLVYARSSAYPDLLPKPETGPYPVLVFVHGWNGFRQQSTFLMQELASRGYIVASLDLPYGARLVVFPDGSLAPNNPNALPPSSSLPRDEYEATARILVNQWSGDLAYTLDWLAEMNNDPTEPLNGLLNMDKIGIFGHSTGGGATIQFCASDLRCQAGLTYDAFVRPVSVEVLETGTKQPFFYLFSELWPFERNTELFESYYAHVDPHNRVATILGADHYDFTDLPALSPLAPQLGLKGPINGGRIQKLLMEYTLAFFDQSLKGQPAPLLAGPSQDYPEVRFDH